MTLVCMTAVTISRGRQASTTSDICGMVRPIEGRRAVFIQIMFSVEALLLDAKSITKLSSLPSSH